jgi:hypothetical protein
MALTSETFHADIRADNLTLHVGLKAGEAAFALQRQLVRIMLSGFLTIPLPMSKESATLALRGRLTQILQPSEPALALDTDPLLPPLCLNLRMELTQISVFLVAPRLDSPPETFADLLSLADDIKSGKVAGSSLLDCFAGSKLGAGLLQDLEVSDGC